LLSIQATLCHILSLRLPAFSFPGRTFNEHY
jgi:hypothetical protein